MLTNQEIEAIMIRKIAERKRLRAEIRILDADILRAETILFNS